MLIRENPIMCLDLFMLLYCAGYLTMGPCQPPPAVSLSPVQVNTATPQTHRASTGPL